MKGYFRKRGNKWSYTLDLGKDPSTGKRKQKTKSGFSTKKEAQSHCASVIAQVEKGNYSEPSKMLFEDYLDKWLESKKQSCSISTIGKYKNVVEKHIKPGLGKLQLSQVEPFHLAELYNHLAEEKELAPTSIQGVHAVIRNCMGQAVKWQLVSKDVSALVDRPKGQRAKIKVWDEHEAKTFLDAAKGSDYYIVFLLALTAGMRQGEIIGLPYNNVDVEKGTISITQSADHRGKRILPSPKTASGYRLITIDNASILHIKNLVYKRKRERLRYGPEYNEHQLLNCSLNGTPLNPRNVLRAFYRIIEKAGVKKITFHEMRHSHATILLKNGSNPKAVAERLGHADASVLLNIYAHVLPNMQRDLADKFGEMFYTTTAK